MQPATSWMWKILQDKGSGFFNKPELKKIFKKEGGHRKI